MQQLKTFTVFDFTVYSYALIDSFLIVSKSYLSFFKAVTLGVLLNTIAQTTSEIFMRAVRLLFKYLIVASLTFSTANITYRVSFLKHWHLFTCK